MFLVKNYRGMILYYMIWLFLIKNTPVSERSRIFFSCAQYVLHAVSDPSISYNNYS